MMTTPLIPVVLDTGLQALWLKTKDGLQGRITHIALGDAGYTPNQNLTGLRSERARYPVADGKDQGKQLHITALADGESSFWVREVAFILESGATLALWSDPDKPLVYKAAGVQLLLAYDLVLSALPPGSVTVQSTGAGLSLAMAEEFAALAAGQISEMHRGLKRDDQLDAIGQRLAIAENRHAYLSEQHNTLASHYAASQTDALTAIAANAAAIVQLQHSFAKTTLGV
jgi:hypothetical protein